MISKNDYLSMADLTSRPKSENRIFVMNTSAGLTDDGVGGDIFITINRLGGDATPVRIPLTSVPVEMTALVPRKDLMASGRFLDSVSRGLITPVKTAAALRELQSPEAIAELRRLQAKAEEMRAAVKAQRAGRTKGRLVFDEEQQEDGRPVLTHGSASGPSVAGTRKPQAQTAAFDDYSNDEADIPLRDVTPQFKAIVNQMNSTDAVTAANKLKTMGALELYKVEYLRDNCVHPKIVKWANKVLGE